MPKLSNNIPLARARIRAAAIELARRAAESHVAIAKQLAPVDTGELRDSIKSLVEDDGSRQVVVEAEHGLYVEFGTVNMDAQPFFMPAYESALKQFKAEATAVIRNELSRARLG